MNNKGGKNVLTRVLVVDDEPFIRKGLSVLLDWEEEGYQIVGEAGTGEEALEWIRDDLVDLVISDIKMPGMGGMELIETARKLGKDKVKFLFISGFCEFEYAKNVIRYKGSDYILKPVQKEELLVALRRINEELETQHNLNREKKVLEKAYLDRNMMALIWGKYDDKNLFYVNDNLYTPGFVRYIDIELDMQEEAFFILPEEKKREYQRKLYDVAKRLLKENGNYVIFDVAKHENVYDIGIILCSHIWKQDTNSEDVWIKNFFLRVSKRMEYCLNLNVGKMVAGIENISESYKDASIARFFKSGQQMKSSEEVFLEKEGENKKVYYRKELDELVHWIEVGDRRKIRETIKSFYHNITGSSTDPQMIELNIRYFLYRLLGLVYEQDGNVDQKEVMEYIRNGAFSFGSTQGSEELFICFANEYAQYLAELRQNSGKGVLRKIEQDIKEHYGESISLKSLGEKYYINSAYLGQVFRKQYNMSFKDYLNGVRIRKAAEMLLRTDKKIYEISECVGYKNKDYFISKFEETYECTPSRFRNMNKKNE